MKIASWNVNSLNVRLQHVLAWLQTAKPDVLGLQETKMEDSKFPVEAIEAAGYRVVFSGQKTYNGVALLVRGDQPPEDVHRGILNFEDVQQRAIAGTVNGVRVINLYVVNGEAVGSEKFEYKMRWFEAMRAWVAAELERYPKLVVMGDFNIAPEDRDVHDPKRWKDKILCSVQERDALAALSGLGLHDAFRLKHEEDGQFSWWDYRLAAFNRGWGLRIDLTLVSDALKDTVVEAGIDVTPRTWERPSDHTPVWVEIA